jgi:acyl-CoA hydrolase
MDHFKLVLPENMNHQGSLFGGYLLKWIDELAYITANLDHPNHKFVTVSLENVVFKHPISCGQILRFNITESRLGNTSIEYSVKVFGEQDPEKSQNSLFETKITFVNITEKGGKKKI